MTHPVCRNTCARRNTNTQTRRSTKAPHAAMFRSLPFGRRTNNRNAEAKTGRRENAFAMRVENESPLVYLIFTLTRGGGIVNTPAFNSLESEKAKKKKKKNICKSDRRMNGIFSRENAKETFRLKVPFLKPKESLSFSGKRVCSVSTWVLFNIKKKDKNST